MSFETMFINFSGGLWLYGFSMCLNASINLIRLEPNSYFNDFASSWWFEGQVFVDSQIISATYDPDSAHFNNPLSLSMMPIAQLSTLTALLFFSRAWSIPIAEKARPVFLTTKFPWLNNSLMESGTIFMSFGKTNPHLR